MFNFNLKKITYYLNIKHGLLENLSSLWRSTKFMKIYKAIFFNFKKNQTLIERGLAVVPA